MIEIPDIDSNFTKEWESNYYKEDPDADRDEQVYQRLIGLVKEDTEQTSTISLDTLKEILDWKDYPRRRLKRYVKEDLWDTVYEPRFRPIVSKLIPDDYYLQLLIWDEGKLKQKLPLDVLGKLTNVQRKAKGFGVPVASTVLHFVFPTKFPIMDVRTREMLYLTDRTNFIKGDDAEGYEQFRLAMLGIQSESGLDLHTIDRALFHFRKKELQKEVQITYKTYSKRFNPRLSKKEMGNGPNIGDDPNFRRLLIDIIRSEAKSDQSTESIGGSENHPGFNKPILKKELMPLGEHTGQGNAPAQLHRGNESDLASKPVTIIGTIVEPHTDRWEISIPKTQRKELSYRISEYPVRIRLVIGTDEYDGLLLFVPSQDGACIRAPLNHGEVKVRLIDTLKSKGFERGHVELQVEGKRIVVLKQLNVFNR